MIGVRDATARWSCLSPRVYQVDTGVLEVLAIPCGQAGVVRSADRSDLRVEPVNRQPETAPAVDDRRTVQGSVHVEGQHMVVERPEHV